MIDEQLNRLFGLTDTEGADRLLLFVKDITGRKANADIVCKDKLHCVAVARFRWHTTLYYQPQVLISKKIVAANTGPKGISAIWR